MIANRDLAQSSIADWQQAINLTDQSIANSTAAKSDLELFIDQNFGTYIKKPLKIIGYKDSIKEALTPIRG
jgi:hypothetical protein